MRKCVACGRYNFECESMKIIAEPTLKCISFTYLWGDTWGIPHHHESDAAEIGVAAVILLVKRTFLLEPSCGMPYAMFLRSLPRCIFGESMVLILLWDQLIHTFTVVTSFVPSLRLLEISFGIIFSCVHCVIFEFR